MSYEDAPSPGGPLGPGHDYWHPGGASFAVGMAVHGMTGTPSYGDTTTAVRLPCQVCGRSLTTRRDGMVKPHKAPRTYEPYAYCRGTGYRHARWEVGQKLRHHTGAIWEVIEDRGGRWGDYLIRCLSLTWIAHSSEKVGREMVTHAEYMHRHGWEAVDA